MEWAAFTAFLRTNTAGSPVWTAHYTPGGSDFMERGVGTSFFNWNAERDWFTLAPGLLAARPTFEGVQFADLFHQSTFTPGGGDPGESLPTANPRLQVRADFRINALRDLGSADPPEARSPRVIGRAISSWYQLVPQDAPGRRVNNDSEKQLVSHADELEGPRKLTYCHHCSSFSCSRKHGKHDSHASLVRIAPMRVGFSWNALGRIVDENSGGRVE